MQYDPREVFGCVTFRPMAVSAHDVAAEIRRRLPGVGVAKVHKLLYYAQGLHLAWTGEPLFREAIEAWDRGPVVADLWHDEDKVRPKPTPCSLDDGQQSILEHVLRRYGARSGADLIKLTHNDGGPWCQVTEQEEPFLPPSPEIDLALIKSWFEGDEAVVAYRTEVARLTERFAEVSEGSISDLVDVVRSLVADTE